MAYSSAVLITDRSIVKQQVKNVYGFLEECRSLVSKSAFYHFESESLDLVQNIPVSLT
jgi:hypothetical protein